MLGNDLLHSGKSLLQTVATLLQRGKGITKWGSLKIGQLCVITKVEQELLQSRVGPVLERY